MIKADASALDRQATYSTATTLAKTARARRS